MINLLINATIQANSLTETSFGGLPIKPIGIEQEWPVCKTCNTQMQYLGKIKTNIGLELIFMCQHDPGMCDDWSADSGGNKVLVVDDTQQLEFYKPINETVSLRNTEYSAIIIEDDSNDYDTAREKYTLGNRNVLGQLFGTPSWYQSDETPHCDCCKKPMRFVAQLEEGPDYETNMNFGGGVAYLFDCEEDKKTKFLWQC